MLESQSQCYCGVQVEDAQTGLPSIAAATLATLLRGHNPWGVERVVLYDCRYNFEFQGGCLAGAINMQVHTPQHFHVMS